MTASASLARLRDPAVAATAAVCIMIAKIVTGDGEEEKQSATDSREGTGAGSRFGSCATLGRDKGAIQTHQRAKDSLQKMHE